MSKIDDTKIQEIVTGRIVPHIYSFETNTLPNYLKVGDTYRPVEERLGEWRRHYKDLTEVSRHESIVEDEVFFRDYSVHKFLEAKGISRTSIDTSRNIFSNEFFQNATKKDVQSAIDDIKNNYKKTATYDYYDNFKKRVEHHYARTQDFIPRDNQQEVITNFQAALAAKRTNLLMYAVMRFGKSSTSMWCAKNMDAKLTVIVSAKADVKTEWKYTVESHKDFTGYRFMDSKDLRANTDIAKLYGQKFISGGGKEEMCTNIVLFLTLQDLAGSTQVIKTHHQILRDAKIDLLIIDETHFGARAQVLGKILAGVELDEDDKGVLKSQEDADNFGTLSKLEAINAKVRLHLSGTPYRILMGSEFEREDVIAFVQFSDIYEAKLAWSAENLDEDEWHNPYYGFPQMVRFAFNPNESSRKLLAGIPGSKPAELFAPRSTKKDAERKYEKFLHEQEVIDLLQVLDGSKDDTELLGILDHKTIKSGKLARHIVIVLPYCASCDALEKLISINKSAFKNIAGYKILNISGHNKVLNKTEDVKTAITKAEIEDQKTITLTVNKMLTGSTVPQWDTMLYLKTTESPQEYDQAIFRLQSPWVEDYRDDQDKVIKYDMKPQTLLVDLSPTRLFYLQEAKAFTYGLNTQKFGFENIEGFIERELNISPIIALNATNNKLVEITATNIIDKIRKYSRERSIVEDVNEIGIDISLKDNEDIYAIIGSLSELSAKSGLSINPTEDEGQDLMDESPEIDDTTDDDPNTPASKESDDKTDKDDTKSFEKRFRAYYALIMLFAFLSATEEKSLTDIIDKIDSSTDNKRIAKSLGLKKDDLIKIRDNINEFALRELDYKIQNSNFRADDPSMSEAERMDTAIHKFGRLSEAEIFTPTDIVDLVYSGFDDDFWQTAGTAKILDIASKSGNFMKSFVEQVAEHAIDPKAIRDNLYSVPTSPAAYEFTRKMYTALGLNIDNIAQYFTSFDLVNLSPHEVNYLLTQDKKFSDISIDDLKDYAKITDRKSEESVKFTAVVGNPPYQADTDNSRKNPIYHLFMEQAYRLSDKVCLITPARFLSNAGHTPSTWNQKMLQDEHLKVVYFEQKSANVFPNTVIKGGVAITYRDVNKDFGTIGMFTPFTELSSILDKVLAKDFKTFSDLLYVRSSYKFTPKLYEENPSLRGRVKQSEERSVGSNIFAKLPEVFFDAKPNDDRKYVKIYGRKNNQRSFKWVRREYIINHPNLERWKVFVSKSNGTGTFGEVLSTPIIGEPLIGGTQTFISFGSFDNELEAINLLKYLKTKFARALLGTMKVTQDNAKKSVWKNVPLQDFTILSDVDWSQAINDIDKQLYAKYDLNAEEIDFIESRVKAME